MSTLDIFIDFMWPVMISLILSSDLFDCSGESPCTTKVGYISLRYGAFICDVCSTCVSQRGIRREFQTWPKSTNGRRLRQSRCMILKVSMWLILPESTNGQCFSKAAVWFWRCPCDVVAVKSHNDFEGRLPGHWLLSKWMLQICSLLSPSQMQEPLRSANKTA